MVGQSSPGTTLLLAASMLTASCASVPPTPPLPITTHAVPAADYPVESIPSREVGTTQVQYLVHVDGSVRDTIIAGSSGSPRLDQAAIQIVSRWRFQPAVQNGRPVPAWLDANVRFELR